MGPEHSNGNSNTLNDSKHEPDFLLNFFESTIWRLQWQEEPELQKASEHHETAIGNFHWLKCCVDAEYAIHDCDHVNGCGHKNEIEPMNFSNIVCKGITLVPIIHVMLNKVELALDLLVE